MKIKTCIVILASLAITACISVPTATNYKSLLTEPVAYSIPELSSVNESQVGDNMLRQGKRRTVEAIELKNSSYRPQNGTSNIYIKMAESDGYFWYADSNSPIFTDAGGSATNGVTIKKHKGSGNLCPFQITGGGYSAGYNCYEGVEYVEIPNYELYSIDSFQQSLMYNGKIGNKINIAYREYSDNKARAAFSNEVEYDMSESNIIAYKGAILKVLEYSNTKIKYEVIKNFN